MMRFLSLIQSLAIVLVAGHLVACQARGDSAGRLQKAEESHAAGDFSRAEIGYKNLLKADEGNVLALSGLGRIWQARGVSLEALRLLSLAKDCAPEDISVRVGFASALFASGYVVEARQEAQRLVSRVLAISPFDLEGGLIQIELWLMDGDADRAVKLGRSLKDVHPPRASLEFGLARAYLIGGNSTPVRESLERAIALDPAHEGATLLLSRQQLAEGDAGNAVELLQGFLALRPGSIPAQSMLVDGYQKSGLVGEATRLLEQRIRNGGDDFTTHLQLGVVHRSAGKPVEARAAFERAEELAPSQLWVIGQLVALDIAVG